MMDEEDNVHDQNNINGDEHLVDENDNNDDDNSSIGMKLILFQWA